MKNCIEDDMVRRNWQNIYFEFHKTRLEGTSVIYLFECSVFEVICLQFKLIFSVAVAT